MEVIAGQVTAIPPSCDNTGSEYINRLLGSNQGEVFGEVF